MPPASARPAPGDRSIRPGAARITLFCLIFFGLAVTEEVSIQLLPLTLQRFTTDAATIGYILALNPLFGFIAQPLVGWWSDHVWTRVGRRAFFLIVAAPMVALCHVAIPFAPLLWQLVLIIVVYQFCQDILWGSDHPLLADLFPSKMRGAIAGLLMLAYALGGVFVTRVGLPLVEAHEKAHGGVHFGAPLYFWAAFLQVTLVAGLAFFLWEQPRPPGPPRPRLTPAIYVQDFLAEPGLFRAACVYFGMAFQIAAAMGFLVIFGTQTLGVSKTDYGQAMGWLPLLSLVYMWPIGVVADRVSRPRLLIVGFIGCAAGYGLAWQAHTLAALAVAFVVFRFFTAVVELTYKAFITDFYPIDRVGQFAGAVNIFYATGRTLSYVVVGQIVSWCANDYRAVWVVAIGAALANVVVMLGVKTPRAQGAE